MMMRRIDVPRAFVPLRADGLMPDVYGQYRIGHALEQIAEMLTIQTEIMVEQHNKEVAGNMSMLGGGVKQKR
jgi:hypothetical protein